MIDVVNTVLETAAVGLFTALFLLVFAWIGLLPMIVVDSKDIDEDEGL